MFDTYIFDLDGTLLDTLEDLTDAVNYVLKKYDLPMRTKEEVRSFVGNGIQKLIERAIGTGNVDLMQAVACFKEYYLSHSAVKTKPYDGIIELLQELKRQGKKTAIVSNKIDSATKKLSQIYFGDLIDVAYGANEEGGFRRKPATDSVELAIEKLNAKNTAIVYIGDSEVDIQTALNANLPSISVLWGFKDEDFLKEHGGTNFVKIPKEILNF